jgi:hypothetical protein
MLMAIAIGMPYQTLNSAMSGTGAPNAVFRPIDANVTVSGTPSASTYQIQLTGQRINRDPMALSPATPSVRDTTINAATKTPGAEKLCQGMTAQLRGQASRKKVTTGCRRSKAEHASQPHEEPLQGPARFPRLCAIFSRPWRMIRLIVHRRTYEACL